MRITQYLLIILLVIILSFYGFDWITKAIKETAEQTAVRIQKVR